MKGRMVSNTVFFMDTLEDAKQGFKRFVDVWHKAETGTIDQAEIHLSFESFSMRA